MKKLLFFLIIMVGYSTYSQVGIGTDTPDPSAQLEIVAQDRGVLIPQVPLTSTTDTSTIASGNVESLLVYNTATATDITPGYYYWYQGSWRRIIPSEEVDIPDNIVVWDVTNEEFTYIDENGDVQVINIEDIVQQNETVTTLSDNGDGTFTYVSEDGTITVIDYADAETLTSLTDNGDGTITYTDEDGVDTVLNIADLIEQYETTTYIVDNGDGTYIYTNEEGDTTLINVPADVIENFENILGDTNVTQEITNLIEEVGGNVYYDGDSFTYLDEFGDTQVIDIQEIVEANETVTEIVEISEGVYEYTNEADSVVTINVPADVIENFENILGDTNVTQEITNLIEEVGGNVYYDGDEFTYLDENGDTQVIDIQEIVEANETVTEIVEISEGVYEYTNEADSVVTINVPADVIQEFETIMGDTNVTNELTQLIEEVGGNVYYDGDSFTYLDEFGDTQVIDIQEIVEANETVTTLALNAGSLEYANEDTSNADINLISTDDNNSITAGTDGALFTPTADLRMVAGDGNHITQDAGNGGNGTDAGTGSGNILIGKNAGNAITTGLRNVGVGYLALRNITTGRYNVGVGNAPLNENTTGNFNVAVGGALGSNTTGNNNTALGQAALTRNTTNSNNVGVGYFALNKMVGANNTAVGTEAGQASTSFSSPEGSGANNTFLGYRAGRTVVNGNNNIMIGANTSPNIGNDDSNQLNIGEWIYGNNGLIGLGTDAANPTERLDVANGNVRVRDINTNTGNTATDNVVVADANGVLKTVTAGDVGNTSEVTQVVTTGNTLATHDDGTGNTTDILETVTTLGIAAGELAYANEDGTNANVALISTDANNGITAGTDGALFADVSALEPWFDQATDTEATDNTQNIYQSGNVAIQKTDNYTGTALDVEGAVHGGSAHSGTVGSNSVVFGYGNEASGIEAAAFGDNNVASGVASTAFGQINEVSGLSATVFGSNNIASGDFSTVLGGLDNEALGDNSVAFGNGTTASGLNSTAFGSNTEASGVHATAFGYGTIASGGLSTALGSGNEASASYSTAFGFSNIASGVFSTAFGHETIATGESSTAFGYDNVASGIDELVFGRYNAITTASTALLQIGNGSSSARANALTVLDNGNIGTDIAIAPTERLDIGSGNVRVRDINTNTGNTATDNVVVADTDGVLKTVAAGDVGNTSEVTQVVTTGNTLATHDDGTGTTTDILETVTTLGIAAGELAYANEDGTNANVALISTDANNAISAGADDALFGENIYIADGTLTEYRTVNTDAYRLDFRNGTNYTRINNTAAGFGTLTTSGNTRANVRTSSGGSILDMFVDNGAAAQIASAGTSTGLYVGTANGSATPLHLMTDGTTRVLVSPTGEINFSEYPNTRDDSGTTSVENILYTDANGDVLSAPAASVAVEPWFGADDNSVATENTEDIYQMAKVGIGSTAPYSALTIVNDNQDDSYDDISIETFGSGGNTPAFIHMASGGTLASPMSLTNNAFLGSMYFRGFLSDGEYHTLSGIQTKYKGDGTTRLSNMEFYTSNADENADPKMILDEEGRLGIGTNDMLGTTNPDVKLAINGSMLTTTSIYADYVFEDYFEGVSELNKEYSFKSLKEVEAFINENRHLPGITKIDALAKNEKGDYVINTSELSVQVLEKVEELYLYTIEQQKILETKEREIQELRGEIDSLKGETQNLNKRLESLEKLLIEKHD